MQWTVHDCTCVVFNFWITSSASCLPLGQCCGRSTRELRRATCQLMHCFVKLMTSLCQSFIAVLLAHLSWLRWAVLREWSLLVRCAHTCRWGMHKYVLSSCELHSVVKTYSTTRTGRILTLFVRLSGSCFCFPGVRPTLTCLETTSVASCIVFASATKRR